MAYAKALGSNASTATPGQAQHCVPVVPAERRGKSHKSKASRGGIKHLETYRPVLELGPGEDLEGNGICPKPPGGRV